MRLDVYLSSNGLAKSRTRAAEMIDEALVSVNGKVQTKASFPVDEGDTVTVAGDVHPYVSRGGLKLQGALDAFEYDPAGKTAVDIGASTGGFTDCLLRRGAKHVYCIDSGSDQLDASLASDSRVTNIEHFNARELSEKTTGERCDVAVCDISFISETYIIPRLPLILKDGGVYIGLIKPQFECGASALGKGGIVKDKRQHKAAILRVLDCLKENNMTPIRLAVSPIEGGDGNREFLVMAVLGTGEGITETTVNEVTK